MSGLSGLFSWLGGGSSATELPEIFPLDITKKDFVSTDVEAIYSRILTDVLERTDGIPAEKQKLLWDNCVASEAPDGLVTLLAKAITDRKDLFLVYDPAIELVREATNAEATQIREDYKTSLKSATGVYITFKKFKRVDMVKLYSALEYCDVSALYKSMNLSKAIQLKLTDLRGSVGLADSADVKAQALQIAQALAAGRDVMTDVKDVIETAKPDLTATNAAMDFIDRKRSFYLGLPLSWITGAASQTMSDTGDKDAKAVERGLKGYYFPIVKPVIEALFDVTTTFKSDDSAQLTSALEALKTFDITSDDYLSAENKQLSVNKLFGLPSTAKGDPPAKVDPKDVTPTDPKQIPAPPPKPAG